MKLEKFKKNTKQKKIIIGTIAGLILLVGGITLYRTFALYEEKKEFNVLKGRVPDFGNYDIDGIAITLDGNAVEKIPERGSYTVSVECTNGDAYWDYANWRVSIGNFSKRTKCNVNFTTGNYFNNYLIAASNTDNNLKKYTHAETYHTGKKAMIDYRYSGKEVNNYICFKNSSCSEDELYRIIGVVPTQNNDTGIYENRVKVIKSINYEGSQNLKSGSIYTKSGKGYFWNETNENVWHISTLYNMLNTEYYQNLGTIKNYIDKTKWYLGAPASSNNAYTTYTSEEFYINERKRGGAYSGGNDYYVNYIGLIYPSDYGYSVESTKIDDIYNKSIYENFKEYASNSWLYSLNGGTYFEWTISAVSDNNSAWCIHPDGFIDKNGVYSSNIFGVRPVFFLKSTVQYKSGDGSKSNPYRISLSE